MLTHSKREATKNSRREYQSTHGVKLDNLSKPTHTKDVFIGEDDNMDANSQVKIVKLPTP